MVELISPKWTFDIISRVFALAIDVFERMRA